MSELINYFYGIENIDATLILYGRNPDTFYSLPERLSILKPDFSFNDNFRLWSSLRRLFFLRKTVSQVNPDVILSFGEYWNSFVLVSLLWKPYPVYISDRCNPNKKFSPFHFYLRKWLYPKAKGIISQTDLGKNLYQKEFKHKNIKVIGNPIRSILSADIERENIVLTVGRLITTKNHDKLIKLFCEINVPGWRLIIVGSDAIKQNNESKLRELIAKLGAQDKVFIQAFTTEIDNYYRRSKVFAFTSESEGFPNVIGEAMAAGLPVIAFDCASGPSEMISDGVSGYLIPLNDYKLFGDRLTFLLNNEELRLSMGIEAIEAIKNFSLEKIGMKYRKFIFPE